MSTVIAAGAVERKAGGVTTAQWYTSFAVREVRGHSPAYERLATGVAGDPVLLGLLDGLREPKRQPNLLFAAVRYLGGPVHEYDGFRDWVIAHWDELAATMLRRRTQTNEVGRCAALLPVLASLPQPLALLEVGTSAGLCLYPDAYRYRYGDAEIGPADSPVRLDCTATGAVPLPNRVPDVVWRAGIDLNPLDVADPEQLSWLSALVWPEQEHRRERLEAAAKIVAADPPRLVRGDLLTELPGLAAEAPAGATLVVFHSAVLRYLSPEERARFRELVGELPGHWISYEGYGVLAELAAGVPPLEDGRAGAVLALDGRPLAVAAMQGQAVRWLDSGP